MRGDGSANCRISILRLPTITAPFTGAPGLLGLAESYERACRPEIGPAGHPPSEVVAVVWSSDHRPGDILPTMDERQVPGHRRSFAVGIASSAVPAVDLVPRRQLGRDFSRATSDGSFKVRRVSTAPARVRACDGMIDLRSDTVTTPSVELRRVMAAIEVGDDRNECVRLSGYRWRR